VVVYFEQFWENYGNSANFWATFFYGSNYALILPMNELGYILGNFFSNSSGHPV
jgi:hypothetical protein